MAGAVWPVAMQEEDAVSACVTGRPEMKSSLSTTGERLGRGTVAVRLSPDTVMVGWRYLSSDSVRTVFNVYRDGLLVTPKPVSVSTQFYDYNPSRGKSVYEVRPVVDGREEPSSGGKWTLPANAPCGYLDIPLQQPEPQTMPGGEVCTYTANDASVGDLDGDGDFEIVLKWEPSNAKDNSHSGFTGTVFLDAYKLDGTRLWRIDLGRNIRAGAHYTQFMVYDLDGDGRAEVTAKTADGTVDGRGHSIGDPSADYRVGAQEPVEGRKGYVASGPEFLTVFDGKTGAALQTDRKSVV